MCPLGEKMAKIWLKLQENGEKKSQMAKVMAKEKYILARTLSMYIYACIEMKNVHNATFPLVLHGTIAKSRIDETISQGASSMNLTLFVCLNRRFTSKSTSIVMLGRCLHFMGRLYIQQVL